MKYLSCKDVGIDCDWSVEAPTEEEIIAKAFEHGKKLHGISELTDELREKIRSSIHEEKAA